MHADAQLLLSLEHRGFVAPRNVLAASEPGLDPSFPFAVHSWWYAWDKAEEHLAEVQYTYCYTLGELGRAAAVDTGLFALRKQTGQQIELAQLEQPFAC